MMDSIFIYACEFNSLPKVKLMIKYKNKEETLERVKDLKIYLKSDNNIKVNIIVDPYVEI